MDLSRDVQLLIFKYVSFWVFFLFDCMFYVLFFLGLLIYKVWRVSKATVVTFVLITVTQCQFVKFNRHVHMCVFLLSAAYHRNGKPVSTVTLSVQKTQTKKQWNECRM